MTLHAIEYMPAYEASGSIKLIGPTPLPMILACNETTTPADVALDCYNKIAGSGDLLIANPDHHAACTEKSTETSSAARDWFLKHL